MSISVLALVPRSRSSMCCPREPFSVIEAGPEEGGGYSWYEVSDPTTGATGFVASNFLRLDS